MADKQIDTNEDPDDIFELLRKHAASLPIDTSAPAGPTGFSQNVTNPVLTDRPRSLGFATKASNVARMATGVDPMEYNRIQREQGQHAADVWMNGQTGKMLATSAAGALAGGLGGAGLEAVAPGAAEETGNFVKGAFGPRVNDLAAHLIQNPADEPHIANGFKAIDSHPGSGSQGNLLDVSHSDMGQFYRGLATDTIPDAAKTSVFSNPEGTQFHVGIKDASGNPIMSLTRSKLPDGTIQLHNAVVSPEYAGQGHFANFQAEEIPGLARRFPGASLSADRANPITSEALRDSLRGVQMPDGSFHGTLPQMSYTPSTTPLIDNPMSATEGIEAESPVRRPSGVKGASGGGTPLDQPAAGESIPLESEPGGRPGMLGRAMKKLGSETGSVDWSREGTRRNLGPAQPFRTTDDMESGWPGAGPEMADGPFIAGRPQGIEHGAYVLGADLGGYSDETERNLSYFPRLPPQNSAEALVQPRTSDYGPAVDLGNGPTEQMLGIMNDHNAAQTYDMSPNELLALRQRGELPGQYAGQPVERVAADLERKVQQSMANGDIPSDRPLPDEEGGNGPIAMSTPEPPGDFRKPAKPTSGAAVDVNPSSIPEKGTTIQSPPWYEEFGLTEKDMAGRTEPELGPVVGQQPQPGSAESPFGAAGSVQGEEPLPGQPATEPDPAANPHAGRVPNRRMGVASRAMGDDPYLAPGQAVVTPNAELPDSAAMPSRERLLGSWANREPQDIQRSNDAMRQAARAGQPLITPPPPEEPEAPAPDVEDPDLSQDLDITKLKLGDDD